MKTRIGYHGGANQQDRMVADKLNALRKALLFSYQSATIVVRNSQDEEGNTLEREFRALINPNKLTMDLDDKILSIPFEDVRLNAPRKETTTQGMEKIGVKVGDIIEWKQKAQSTFWIVYDQYLQEIAYFRGQMRQCEQEPLDIDGVKHYYYLKGPDEKGISWQKSKHFFVNELNYSVEMYISKTQKSTEFFQRFAKVKLPIKKLNGEIEARPFEVQAVDDISSEGVLVIYLKEDFNNKWESIEEEKPSDSNPAFTQILGKKEIYPYSIEEYQITNLTDGTWSLNSSKARIVSSTPTKVKIEVLSGRTGEFELVYSNFYSRVSLTIKILSL